MSEHAWSQDLIAIYVAGGLDAVETDRLETHVRECSICAAAIDEARTLDRQLGTLLASTKPGPGLEDRMIRSLHVYRAADLLRSRWKRNLLIGVAASLGFGIVGAGMSVLAREGGLGLPGVSFATNEAESHPDVRLVQSPAILRDDLSGKRFDGESTESSRRRSHVVDPTDGWRNGSGAVSDPEAMARELRDRHANLAASGDRGQFSSYSLDSRASGRTGATNKSHDASTNELHYSEGRVLRSGLGPVAGLAFSPDGSRVASGSGGERSKKLSDSAPDSKDSGVDLTKRGIQDWSERPEKERSRAYFAPSEYKSRHDEKGVNVVVSPKANEQYGMALSDLQKVERDKKLGSPQQDITLALPSTQGQVDPKPNAPPAEVSPRKIIIRTGEVEFEIESFDSATASVIKLVNAIKNGYVATINSEKLANGKVKGSIVVRVPPESLDGLVLDLRRDLGKVGELKGQRIGSQDITKQYTDIESRLKAAKTMQDRLLAMIKDGKGEIKQLLDAEKELGVWRTKIEEMEGEIRYYNSQVSLSTLTITLAEKEIKSAAGLTESERVQAGLEVEDVEKAQQQLLAAIAEAKGRVTKSEMKQHGTGQYNATVNFEAAPEQAGPLRDRLRQLGVVTRLEVDRVQTAEGGTPQKESKVKRGDTQFLVQLYNVTRMNARETATLQLATPDVITAYRNLKNAVAQVKGRVLKADLNENDKLNVTGELHFEVRRADEAAVQTALAAAGDVFARNVTRAAEDENSTDAKVKYQTTLVSADRLNPREMTKMSMEVSDVDQTLAVLKSQVAEVKGRVVRSDVARERSGKITARFICEVPLASGQSTAERFRKQGTERTFETNPDPQAYDGKYAVARIEVVVANSDLIVPSDGGATSQLRKGLSWSLQAILFSLSWLVVGLLVVLPWGLVGYGAYRVGRKLFAPAVTPPKPVEVPTATTPA